MRDGTSLRLRKVQLDRQITESVTSKTRYDVIGQNASFPAIFHVLQDLYQKNRDCLVRPRQLEGKRIFMLRKKELTTIRENEKLVTNAV